MKNKIFGILRILISFSLLGGLFWLMRDQISGVYTLLITSNIALIIFSILFMFINVILLAYRMKIIFVGEDLNISLAESLQLTFIGLFFNNFLPTAIGGDIMKAHYASNLNKKKTKSYASVFMDRFIGLYTFLIIATVALVIDHGRIKLHFARNLIIVLVVLGTIGIIIITSTRIAHLMERLLSKVKMLRLGERLHAVYIIIHDYRNRQDVVVKSFLISIVAQCIYFGTSYLLFLSLNSKISIGSVFLIMPIVAFIAMLPSIGGLGVREGAIVAFFSPLVGKEKAFAVSLLFLCLVLFSSVIGGAVHLWWNFNKIRRD